MPIARRYRVDRMFQVRRLECIVSCHTIDARTIPLHGNRYFQVFATKDYFVDVYPLKRKSDCNKALD